MSGRSHPPERLVALYVTVIWAAVLFAIDGVLAIVLDRDPVPEGIGPYYAVLAFVVAGFLVWLVLSGTSRSDLPVLGAVAAAASVYLAYLVVAVPWGLELVAQQVLSPFVIAAAVLAATAVVATWLVLRELRWRGHRR